MKPSQLIASLPHLLELNRALMIWGKPGIGKSQIVHSVARAKGLDVIDLRLNIYDPTELKGFPTKSGTGKAEHMRFVPSGRLPTKGKGILFLDELPSASPATQAAAYQLILDRRLDEYVLPDGWRIVAAGNNASDGGVHYSMAPALANRFLHLNLEADADEWDVWAAVHNISPITRAFIRFRPALLHDVAVRKTGQAFPTPRSWELADEVLAQGHDTAMHLEVQTGAIGEGPATEFVAFAAVAAQLPSVNEISLTPDVAPVPKDPSAKYAITTLLESAATPKNLKSFFTYMKRLDLEFQAAFAEGISRTKRELVATADFIDWCTANKALLK
jgi:MoxR-like ATPase